jgi:hypothetical protein
VGDVRCVISIAVTTFGLNLDEGNSPSLGTPRILRLFTNLNNLGVNHPKARRMTVGINNLVTNADSVAKHIEGASSLNLINVPIKLVERVVSQIRPGTERLTVIRTILIQM